MKKIKSFLVDALFEIPDKYNHIEPLLVGDFFEIFLLELLDSYIYYKPKHLNNIFGEVPILVEWNTGTFCYRSC